jgi:hypothetical protein
MNYMSSKFGFHIIYLFQVIVPAHPKHYGSLDRQYYTPVGGSCTPTLPDFKLLKINDLYFYVFDAMIRRQFCKSNDD